MYISIIDIKDVGILSSFLSLSKVISHPTASLNRLTLSSLIILLLQTC
jgi:hypothetical protein